MRDSSGVSGGLMAAQAALAKDGVDMEDGALHALVAGVAAAPPAAAEQVWPAMLHRPLGPETLDCLEHLRTALVPPTPGKHTQAESRLAAVRALLSTWGLDGLFVPHGDEHRNESLPDSAQRLAWLTGFVGSAGAAVVLAHRAALFVDGRYTTAARRQVSETLFEHRHLLQEPPVEWLKSALPDGGRVGYDPWLVSRDWLEKAIRVLQRTRLTLVALETNPIDALWRDRPAAPLSPVILHDDVIAGTSRISKCRRIARDLVQGGADAAVLTLPDSIAWLLNIRGGDVPNIPVILSFAILHSDGRVIWFVDARKVGPEVAAALGDGVTRKSVGELAATLQALGAAGCAVRVDPGSAPAWMWDRLEDAGATLLADPDPCALPKAIKTPAEIDGSRAAHLRDGIAMVRFLHWLDGAAADGNLGEIAAAERLTQIRAEHPHYRDDSFPTISAAGPNAAVVHYRPSRDTEERLADGTLYLVDSGGQYRDGTTDVTRTIAIGTPTDAMCRHFTLVLKGLIALTLTRFPEGTTGSQLDALARWPLWQAGLDYDHGTGHGVGSYLDVHEGPQRIGKQPSTVPLRVGMILSNEPGFYRDSAYGIRIENLTVVQPATNQSDDGRRFLCFETLTLVPIDRRLIVLGLLTAEERDWLNAYHARVRAAVAPSVDAETNTWLQSATAPIG